MDKEWIVEPHGGTWSILTKDGDVIADDIPHGYIADYIVANHHEKVRAEYGFREVGLEEIARDDGDHLTQCPATCPPYRCVHTINHTGPQYTYGLHKNYLFGE